MVEKRLLTLAEVLSVAASNGRPVTASTFRTYVAKKLAPQPTHRRSRTPLWDSSEIEGWLQNDFERTSSAHAEQALAIPDVMTEMPAVSLRSSHLVRLDPALPFPEALVKAEGELKRRVDELRDVVSRLQAAIATTCLEGAIPPRHFREGLIAGLLQRREAARIERQRNRDAEEDASYLKATTIALRDAEGDHELVNDSVLNLLAWAEAEKKRRVAQVLDAEVEQERAQRRLKEERGRRFESAIAFIRDDPERLSWVSSSSGQRDEPPKAAVLDAIAGTPSDFDPYDIFLVLGGADFGYHWRQDGTDTRLMSSDEPLGGWRVSWLQASGELYAQFRPEVPGWNSPKSRLINSAPVWLIGRTPRTSLRSMIDWLAPLERRQSERNSLSIVFDAFDEQESADFPALRIHKDAEIWDL